MTSTKTADIIICGAGIAGIATAYHLSVTYGLKNIILIDERPPLSLTSDKSTEAYRNWWPGPGDAMVRFMNRSIDLLEEMAHQHNNTINLNRRGYLYATANPTRIDTFKHLATEAAELGAGPVRYHTGQADSNETAYQPAPPHAFENQPTGADIILDQTLIQKHFPYLSEKTVAVVHARRCGWFSGQQLGILMLEQAQAQGVHLIEGRVESVDIVANCIKGVNVNHSGGSEYISTNTFVNAAGPLIAEVGQMLGLELPVFSELHLKMNFKDHLNIVPREAPLIIWADPQHLPWSEEEREMLSEEQETRWLLDEFPAGVHARPDGPDGSPIVLMLWDYHHDPVPPIIPIPDDPDYPEVVLRGLSTAIPALSTYIERMPKPFVDGGYYTKTRENRPLIGPLPVEGAYIIGALSGYGLMAAPAGGELLAAHISGSPLPEYAPAFVLARYENPAYQKLLENWGDSGQL